MSDVRCSNLPLDSTNALSRPALPRQQQGFGGYGHCRAQKSSQRRPVHIFFTSEKFLSESTIFTCTEKVTVVLLVLGFLFPSLLYSTQKNVFKQEKYNPI